MLCVRSITTAKNGSFEHCGTCGGDTKPRGIKATCTVSGNSGRPRIRAYYKQRKLWWWVCLQIEWTMRLTQSLLQASLIPRPFVGETCNEWLTTSMPRKCNGKVPMQQTGVKEGGGCLLEGGVFSGAYSMSHSHTFQYLSHKCPKRAMPIPVWISIHSIPDIGLQFYVVEIEIFNKASQ